MSVEAKVINKNTKIYSINASIERNSSCEATIVLRQTFYQSILNFHKILVKHNVITEYFVYSPFHQVKGDKML